MEAQKAAYAGDFAKLKKFWNTRLALTWEQPGDRIKAHALQERAQTETYRLGTVPPGGATRRAVPCVLTMRIETIPAAAACSQYSPRRPMWQE